jgi:hypothetical protein
MLLTCLFVILVALFLTVANNHPAKQINVRDLPISSNETLNDDGRKMEKNHPVLNKPAPRELELV